MARRCAPSCRWPQRAKWIHALSAGVEKVLSPELIESPVPLTNGRGVFGPALAEFAIAAMLFFAKDLRRLIRQQEAARWEQFDVAFLRDQTLGVIGYGGIGREAARLAHALGMKVMALRRRTPSSENDPILERSFTREQLNEMLSLSDYVVAAAPLTPETQGMLGTGEFHFMKTSAVFINVGRGAVVVEPALISALNQAFCAARRWTSLRPSRFPPITPSIEWRTCCSRPIAPTTPRAGWNWPCNSSSKTSSVSATGSRSNSSWTNRRAIRPAHAGNPAL